MALDEEARSVAVRSSERSDGTCEIISPDTDLQVWVKTGALVEANINERFPPPYSIAVAP